MRKEKIIVLFAALAVFTGAVFFAACAGDRNTEVITNSTATGENEPATIDSHRTFRIDYRSEPDAVQAGTPTTLILTVKDKQGAVVKDLQIVHEKPMHLLIVSKDLAEFYHVHPEQSADGSYKVTHTFASGGDYKMYADFTPKDAVQVVEQIDVKAAGPERAKVPLVPDTKLEKTIDGLKVVMKPSEEIKAGQELTLDFQAFDAASGKPANDLQNYLGELAHFVIISEDLKDFVHAHPMAKGESMDSMNMGEAKREEHKADGHEHSRMEGTVTKPGASEVSAHTAFPRAGLYKLWAQFQRGGKVISVPFIVNVPAGSSEPAKAANVPAGATQITVSANGYEPSSVPVKKGQSVKLAFYRPDASGCGGEVVFPKQNITRKLPVGETVIVEFTPSEAGEIVFACGMDMMRGKIVVSEN
ncbi:MAG: cupredoxin domain-containing protein [Pyrinomonadaceae bacterium]